MFSVESGRHQAFRPAGLFPIQSRYLIADNKTMLSDRDFSCLPYNFCSRKQAAGMLADNAGRT
jgi:hypothetical protein